MIITTVIFLLFQSRSESLSEEAVSESDKGTAVLQGLSTPSARHNTKLGVTSNVINLFYITCAVWETLGNHSLSLSLVCKTPALSQTVYKLSVCSDECRVEWFHAACVHRALLRQHYVHGHGALRREDHATLRAAHHHPPAHRNSAHHRAQEARREPAASRDPGSPSVHGAPSPRGGSVPPAAASRPATGPGRAARARGPATHATFAAPG